MHERSEEQAPAPAAEVVAAKGAATQVEHILALQQTIGNRAVARMIAAAGPPRAPAPPHRTLARDDKATVNEYVKEETDLTDNITWTASFDVWFESATNTCWATIKIQLVPDAGVSDDDVKWVKSSTETKFADLWDKRYSFHEHRWYWTDLDWTFRPKIEWVDSGGHETVHLHPGKGTQSNRTNWYLQKPEVNASDPSKSVPAGYSEVEHAHEVSHQMGLLDEYENIHVKNRKTYSDHSLLGDYANEGIDKVALMPRHGERMAAIIAKATGKNLQSKMVR